MKQEKFMKDLEEKINNKEPFKIDLKNGVILDLNYDNSIKAYRGYMKEENVCVGIWTKKTISMILTGEIQGIEILL